MYIYIHILGCFPPSKGIPYKKCHNRVVTIAAKHQHICMEAYMYVDILYIHYTYTYIYAYMYMYTHTFAVTWMNYDGHINSSRLTLMLIPISLAWLPKSIFGQLENAKNHVRHKGSRKKHANPLFEAWICESFFVGSHVFCWTLASETNHNNIGETRNKPVSQFPSFGCVLTKSPSMNDHCCPSRSTASWEEKVEVPNLGKISLVVDVVGLVLRIMRLWVCVNKNINIYELCVCIYPMPMYNWCSHLLVHIYYEGSIFHDGAMALHHHRTRNFTSF